MPQSPAPVTVPDVLEARVTVSVVRVPVGCGASQDNGAMPVGTGLFSLCGICPVKPPAQLLHLRWLGVWPGSG